MKTKTIIFPYTPKLIKEFFDDVAKIEHAIATGGNYLQEIERVNKESDRIMKKYSKNKMA